MGKNFVCCELCIVLKREIFLHVDVLKGQHVGYINHVGEFWCFLIQTSMSGKLLNQGCLQWVSLYILICTQITLHTFTVWNILFFNFIFNYQIWNIIDYCYDFCITAWWLCAEQILHLFQLNLMCNCERIVRITKRAREAAPFRLVTVICCDSVCHLSHLVICFQPAM